MTGRILILGAAGRLGRAAAEAFHAAGWTVVSQVRPGASARAVQETIIVEDDGMHREAMIEHAAGADVVLHALNAPYWAWPQVAIPMVNTAIACAEAAGATLLFPGNVYNYGKAMPPVIDETTPMAPTARKGTIRLEAEKRLQRAANERGVRTIVLRAGDFYGAGSGSWFDLIIARDVSMNIVRYPGPLDVVHSWAFLPDLARTMVKLAEKRADFAPYETFGFPGHAMTGRQLLAAMEKAVGRKLTRKIFPWPILYVMSPFVKAWRELVELAYLWRVPHAISGDKLAAAIGPIPATPFERAVREALDPLSRQG